MAQALGVLAAAGLIAVLELPSLRKKQLRKETWVFWFFLLLATALNLAEAMQIELPNPIDLLGVVFKPMGELLDKLFHK